MGDFKGHVQVSLHQDSVSLEVDLEGFLGVDLAEFFEVSQVCINSHVLNGSNWASSWPLIL